MMKIHQAVATALLDHGVNPLFGLMGDANMLYVGDYRELGGRFIPSSHEVSSVGMANAWAQATGRVGVTTVTCGPGIANTFITLVEAVKSSTPVLLMTGDAPLEPTHFQQLDIAAMAAAAGAGYEVVLEPSQAIRTLNRALQRVVSERRPVVFNLPQHMLLLEAGTQEPVTPPRARAAAAPGRADLARALDRIRAAKRPIILAGKGALNAGAHEALVCLADQLAAPVTTTVLAKDLFLDHPSNLGICGGLSHPAAVQTISESDCILVFGAALNAYTTHNRELLDGSNIIQIDDTPASFGKYLHVAETVPADARLAAEAISSALTEHRRDADRDWLERVQARLRSHDPRADFDDQSHAETIDIRTASIRLNEVLPARRNMVSDIGRFVFGAWPHITTPEPEGFTTMGAFGSVGLGLAGSLGMAAARPDAPTVCVIGDGGFMMNPTELATAVRESMRLIVVIYDDGAYGFEWHKMLNFGADPAHSLLAWPDLESVAKAMGATSRTIRRLDELDEVPKLTDDIDGPVVLVVKLDPTVNIAQ
ncbi:thiamine pyrophosphate-binding protein [Streptomyces thinghirensis]